MNPRLTFTRTLEYQVAPFEALQRQDTRPRPLTTEDVEEAFRATRATDRILTLRNGAVTESGERASTHGPMHRRIVR